MAEPTVAQDWIPVMVERLVREFDPLKIILFGSHARGGADRNSDVDLLVVLPRLERKGETMVAMRRLLADLPVPKDVIPTDPDEIQREGHLVGSVLKPALAEGKVIYQRG